MMPERVFVSQDGEQVYHEGWDSGMIRAPGTAEYLRADLHDARVKALEARIAALTDAMNRLANMGGTSASLTGVRMIAREALNKAKSLEAKGG